MQARRCACAHRGRAVTAQIAGEAEQLGQLLAFVRTARAGTFSAAARQLGCTPSALSRPVARLEQRLSVRLFQRHARRMCLTEEGRLLLHEAEAVQRALDGAAAAAESLAEQARGVLRIHVMPSFAMTQIAPHVPAFQARHPDIRLAFELEARFADRFDAGVDVAIHSGSLPDCSHVAQRVAAARWGLYAAPSYLEAQGNPATPAALVHHRCLGFEFDSPWNAWPFDGVEGPRTWQAMPAVSATQGDLLRELALNGAGIARLATYHVAPDLQAGRLVAVLPGHAGGEPEPIWFIHAGRKHLSPRIRVFREFLTDRLAKAAWNEDARPDRRALRSPDGGNCMQRPKMQDVISRVNPLYPQD